MARAYEQRGSEYSPFPADIIDIGRQEADGAVRFITRHSHRFDGRLGDADYWSELFHPENDDPVVGVYSPLSNTLRWSVDCDDPRPLINAPADDEETSILFMANKFPDAQTGTPWTFLELYVPVRASAADAGVLVQFMRANLQAGMRVWVTVYHSFYRSDGISITTWKPYNSPLT